MIIYKCDRCGNELMKREELYRICIESEKYDDSDGWHCWRSYRHSGFYEVCEKCEKELRSNFLDDLKGAKECF
jgi:hypothetical protein